MPLLSSLSPAYPPTAYPPTLSSSTLSVPVLVSYRYLSRLPEVVLSSPTNLLTILRDPFRRLQSDYHYIRSKPQTEHLAPEVNVTELLQSVKSFRDFVFYPGISNCATKMLNGIPSGSTNKLLTDEHLVIAKKVLLATLWFGISEYFDSSVCLLAWMYGSEPKLLHFKTLILAQFDQLTWLEFAKLMQSSTAAAVVPKATACSSEDSDDEKDIVSKVNIGLDEANNCTKVSSSVASILLA